MLINNHEVLSNRSILCLLPFIGWAGDGIWQSRIYSILPANTSNNYLRREKILCIGNSLEADGQEGCAFASSRIHKSKAALLIGAENNSEADYSAPAFSLTD